MPLIKGEYIMKSSKRKLLTRSYMLLVMVALVILVMVALFVFTSMAPVGAASKNFLIGAFWIPRDNYTNAVQYDYLHDANVDYLINTDNNQSNMIDTVAENKAAMDLCTVRGMTFVPADSRWSTYNVGGGSATNVQIDKLAADYKSHSAIGGYYVCDEPGAGSFKGLAREYKRFLSNNPNAIPYLNLLPTYANMDQMGVHSIQSIHQSTVGSGYYVSPTNRLGQTFTTASDCYYIDYVTMNIDSTQWSNTEPVTLTLWDSTSRTKKISQYTLYGSNGGNYPTFILATSVSPNTSYYMELTHDSGGDNIVGWVTCSSNNVYSDGSAYQNGAALQNNDFYFQICRGRSSNDKSIGQLTTNDGAFINGTTKLGQTFKTPSTLNRRLQFIEMFIDKNSWGGDEWLAVNIYDNPSKNQLLGTAAMNATNNGYFPRFYIDADLKPNTTYYMELVHNGAGNNQAGWVCRASTDVYPNGSAYINGIQQNNDFYFRAVFKQPYEDYCEEWVNTVGASNLKYLSYDHYPYNSGSIGITADYFTNLEYVRNIGLQKNVKISSFMQSTGIVGNGMRRPNANEIRYNVYTTLAYGVKGLTWFTWWTPNAENGNWQEAIISKTGTKSDLYTSIKKVNGEVKKLGPTLMGLTSQAVYHSGVMEKSTQSVPNNFWWKPASTSDNVIISYFTNSNGRKYIMAVNRDLTTTHTLTFKVKSKPSAVNEVSKLTGSEVNTNYNSSTGVLSGSFLPGEGKLYALP